MGKLDSTWEKIMNMLYKHRSFFRYGMYSVIVTIIDGAIVYLILGYFSNNIVIANTVGIVVGFLIHYCLSIKNVFEMKSDRIVFWVYLGTFLMGLAIADYIIWLFYVVLKAGFLVSKGASIAIPFLAIYEVRNTIYSNMRKESK